jgi:nucleoside-diphosphate-sugar epimerase
MHCLVTGVTGFVGKQLISELFKRNHTVIEAGRRCSEIPNANFFEINNITTNTNWTDALNQCNVIIHLAARVHVIQESAESPLLEFRKVNVDGTLNLAKQAAEAGVKRFIFISSVKVNGEQSLQNKPYNEKDIPNPQDPYGISKWEAEQGLWKIAKQTEMEIVIIRPPLIYGPGVKANFASLINVVKKPIPLPLGAINNKRSLVYVGNLIDFIIRCIDHPAAANETFLVSDDNDLSTTELLRACAKALNKKIYLMPISQALIEWSAIVLGRKNFAQRLCGNLQVDITKAKNLLGWSPPITVDEGLKASFFNTNETYF